ncbi:nucleotide-binding protein [Methylobacterium sp. E-016]|uniref:nucleotide-binding protein n=1 Tax=Methylobacterium sp. E-016 TaxID=2836556 RepID=UPI001FBB275A|nr:nucleotide-binding protein [Methylobacterium sp. E-016]MCJ2078112.1 nucleotide-binding protein [Methylobacterium sp. E-016]
MNLLDLLAAPAEAAWWYDSWQDGDPIPAGWYPPKPGAEVRKPTRVTIVHGRDDDLADEVIRFLREGWFAGHPFPIAGVHETVRRDGEVLAVLEAYDGGIAEVRLEGERGAWRMWWQYVPGASARDCYSGLAFDETSRTWQHLPAITSLD